MTAHTITTRIKNADTEPLLDAEALALLFGVDLTEVLALPTVDGHSGIPREWIKRGRRRTREAQAATGSDFILDALDYWARKDHGAALEVIYQ
ncbi:hypothetical protein [Mycolicibacterium sp. CR10]|uniref:hypothetical protein n=1 Tax=Mycolicibacterium sp. CR10 TaxID=2562314 RepID=UPI0010BFD9C6|nr:hypothetical protein [Mycolicibacterium sp. CR10]